MRPTKRVLVTFTAEQWALIRPLIGRVGRGDADTVRGIVVSWIFEKGYGSREVAPPRAAGSGSKVERKDGR
jgi:hypothetical protein